MGNVYNKTILIGRVTGLSELKTGSKGVDYISFGMCNCDVDKNGETTELHHKLVAFGKQAQLINQYIKKGDLVCVEGRLDVTAYEGKRDVTIVAERITFLSSKRKSESEEVA